MNVYDAAYKLKSMYAKYQREKKQQLNFGAWYKQTSTVTISHKQMKIKNAS